MDLDGWVKLHRQLIKSRVFANEGLLKVWIWCLLKANHEKEWVPIKTGRGTTEIEVFPGQFIFGRKTSAKDLRMNPSTVWKRMLKLKNIENLDIQSDTHFSVISINNWETYQLDDTPKVTGKVTGKEQPSNTNKNDKNIYTVKLQEFVGNYINFIKEKYPTKSPKGKNLKSSSLETVDKLIRLDGFEEDYVFNALRWAQKDDFWKTNVFSLAGLRKKSHNGLTKFQNISNAYDKDQPEESKPKVPVFRVAASDL